MERQNCKELFCFGFGALLLLWKGCRRILRAHWYKRSVRNQKEHIVLFKCLIDKNKTHLCGVRQLFSTPTLLETATSPNWGLSGDMRITSMEH